MAAYMIMLIKITVKMLGRITGAAWRSCSSGMALDSSSGLVRSKRWKAAMTDVGSLCRVSLDGRDPVRLALARICGNQSSSRRRRRARCVGRSRRVNSTIVVRVSGYGADPAAAAGRRAARASSDGRFGWGISSLVPVGHNGQPTCQSDNPGA